IQEGKWMERVNDVEETEKMILRKVQKGENVKDLIS
ncbi:MAG: TRAP transporter permease DctQ, partial [Candidatus Fonsibacter lacus]|nr:TRAP transporter permease DctQ [Candidatus Fonsibacter lacus]